VLKKHVVKYKYVARYDSKDGSVYFLNAETGKIQRICDIKSPDDLPSGERLYFRGILKAIGEQLK
jgi:hypothetical protein